MMLSGCIDTVGSDRGDVSLYMSDQPAAIEDFDSLEVTVTEVGFSQTEEANETDNNTNSTVVEDGENFTIFEVDNGTIDLTNVVGDNATLVGQFEVPNGTYERVYVEISDVNATLDNGEQVNVKLPSNKLQINEEFTVGDCEEVSFIYDIHVVKAGQSGKYILRPVVSESGLDNGITLLHYNPPHSVCDEFQFSFRRNLVDTIPFLIRAFITPILGLLPFLVQFRG